MPGQVELRQVPVEMVSEPDVWPALLPHIESACAYSGGRITPEAVQRAATKSEMQVFAVILDDTLVGVGVTCLSLHPSGLKSCDVLLVGGTLAGLWAELEAPLRRWALGEGCQRLQMVGRKGWARALPNWKIAATMYELEIA